MSCTLHLVGTLKDLSQIHEFLGDSNEEEDVKTLVDDTPIEKCADKSWLQTCCLAISLTEEVFVVAKRCKAVFLAKKWTNNVSREDESMYVVEWSGKLSTEEEDVITCISCASIASKHRSSKGFPEWTCVVVGFQSGYIRIYMTNGNMLISQFLHDSPVLSVKLKTLQPFQTRNYVEQVDELLVIFEEAIIRIDGFSLCQSLRACRNQLAKAKASSSEYNVIPTIAYNKWKLSCRAKDSASCGTVTPCLFDRLQNVSNSPDSSSPMTARCSAPAYTQFLSVGKDPFVNLHHALQGRQAPIISEVAVAVASQLTSAVLSRFTVARGWWTGNEGVKSNEKPKVEKGESISSRFCLYDKHRHAEMIVLSPIGGLAAIRDTLNRVLLFDLHLGIIVRMWKGYREAECGWIAVEDETRKRRALFLVIYTPRRGILEIYLSEQGVRVGSFNVGKNCRLLYNGYHCLGSIITQDFNVACNDGNQCFIMQEDGQVKAVQLPFHCALSIEDCSQLKEVHLLKKFTNIIANTHLAEETLTSLLGSTVKEMDSGETLQKAYNLLVECASLPSTCFASVFHNICNQLQLTDWQDSTETKMLMYFMNLQTKLVSFYQLKNDSEKVPDIEKKMVEVEEIEEVFQVDRDDALRINTLIKSFIVSILNNTEKSIFLHISDLLTAFTLADGSESSLLRLKEDIPEKKILALGCFLFQEAFTKTLSIHETMDLLQSLNVQVSHLLLLLVSFGQSEIGGKLLLSNNGMKMFHEVLFAICMLDDPGGTGWQQMQDNLSRSTHVGQAFIVACICRSVLNDLPQTEGSSSDVKTEWNLIIARLENLVELTCFVHLCNSKTTLTPTRYAKTKRELNVFENFSVESVLGSDFISRVVAKCVVVQGIPGPCLGESITKLPSDEIDEEDTVKHLSSLRLIFPCSLSDDVLWAHCTWEAVMLWKDDIEDVGMLSSALVYLSCIHNGRIQHGLAVLFWKTVFKESVLSLFSLVMKAGKSPDDRLCKKTVNLGRKSIHGFLLVAKQLLEILLQVCTTDDSVPNVQSEEIWLRKERSSLSITEQASQEALCESYFVKHLWCLVTSLYVILNGKLRSIKMSTLFDSKGRHAFRKSIQASPVLSENYDEKVITAREQFCESYVRSRVTSEENHDLSELSRQMELVLELSRHLLCDVDWVCRKVVCELYSAGVDDMGKEFGMLVDDKCALATELVDVVGVRLRGNLLREQASEDARVCSRLPAHIYTWLRALPRDGTRTISLTCTYQLIEFVCSMIDHSWSHEKLFKELLESLADFL